ncbi:MAG TPA: hypothetical protein VMH83_07265, partial [Candidatus Acidoferrum sp.]|nr:hypothetical protein [Candidatus Acidoferrum sp.]
KKSPVQITTSVGYVNSGEFQTIFIKKDGTFWAMGDNGGSTLLGDGSSTDKTSPTKMQVTGTAALP